MQKEEDMTRSANSVEMAERLIQQRQPGFLKVALQRSHKPSLRLPNMQLLYLFASSFTILFVGMGLFPVLPVYATEFGATRTVIGIYYALMFAANAAGAMLTNRLAAVMTRKGLFVIVGVLGIPTLMLLGQASSLWQVMALSAIIWFCGGVGLALINVFTGQYASDNSRGKSFSLMFLAFPLGAVFGGTLVGKLVATAGYHTMFMVMGAIWAVLPAIGLFKLKVASEARAVRSTTTRQAPSTGLGSTFYRVLAMTFLAAIAINLGRLGTPLVMQAQGFTASEISSTATVSGLITIPVVLLIGALSDRLGRKTFLMLGYAAAGSGAVMLALSTELWMFWVAATLVLVALCANGALASALVADTLSAQGMERGLPWINAMNPIAGVLGFTGIGFLMDRFGQTPVFVIAVTVALLAAVLLNSLRRERPATSVNVEDCETRDALGKCMPAAETA
jgi:MFS family permease